MGAFHAGHHSLIRAARERCDDVVVSLFVNPAQFDEAADLAAYPRDEARDAAEAAELGVDVLYAPAVEEVYPPGFATTGPRRGPVRRARGRRARPRPLRRRLHGRDQAAQRRARPTSRSSGRRTPSRSPCCAGWCATSTCPSSSPCCRPCASPTGSRCRAATSTSTPPSAAARSRSRGARAPPRPRWRAASATPPAIAGAARAAMDGVEPEYLALVDPDSFQPIADRRRPGTGGRGGAHRRHPPHRQHHHPHGGDPRAGADHLGGTADVVPAPHDRKPVTLTKLAEMRALGEPIVMVTAYDHPSALVVEEAGVDVVLVGDSAANNVLGYEDTVPVTVEELLMLAAAVRRGLRTPLLVGDLPFGSYEASDAQAIATAHRFVKEAGCDAVKLEGGGAMAERAQAIVRAGVPVMGHVGLTPQTATALGGYRAQGRTAERAQAGARGRARAAGGRLLRDRLRGDPGRGDRRDHGPHGDPGDRDRRRRQHRRAGARAARPARHPRRLQAEVRQALRRREGRDAARGPGVRRRGAHARVPGAGAQLRDRARGARAATRQLPPHRTAV